MPICLQVYTFVVAASLSSTYSHVRLRRLLAAASVSNLNANWYYTCAGPSMAATDFP